MISVDTDILLNSQNADCPENPAALNFLQQLSGREDVPICELVLVELYILLRNPAVLSSPLSAGEAVNICQGFRSNPRWRLVENVPIMDKVWEVAANAGFARRKIIDLRLARTLQHHGMTRFATANLKDFRDLGFHEVWNPLLPS